MKRMHIAHDMTLFYASSCDVKINLIEQWS